MSTEHHHLFAPSSFPALQHCCHFRSSGEADQYSDRGQRIHNRASSLCDVHVAQCPLKDKDEEKAARWAAEKMMELIPDDLHLNHHIEIVDELTGEQITFGECDAWGYSHEELRLVDIKSGMKGDYRAQVMIYALGLMERENVEVCHCYILYADTQEVGEYLFTRAEANEMFAQTVYRVENATGPLTVNPYCGRCKLQPTCPAWVMPASRAVVPLEPSLEVQFTGGLEKVAADPKLLGEFLIAWEMAETLVEKHKLREKAIEYIKDKKDVAGWRLSFRKGREHFEPKEVKRFIKDWIPYMNGSQLMKMIKILPKEFEEYYTKFFTNETKKARGPAPIQPSRAKGYAVLLRRKPG